MVEKSRVLGRTGLQVTPIGLGGGGNSRLGLSTGQDLDHAADVVRAALDLGLNMLDTARVYGTEIALGRALSGRTRQGLVVSSKSPYLDEQRTLLSPQAFEENLHTSLRELGLETIDIYFIHGLRLEYYEAARQRFLPVLERARQAGKIRFIGVTEAFETDTTHEMLQRAVHDPEWQVMMVGFNLLNQSARQRVLPFTRHNGTATLGMFAVRRALIDDHWLRTALQRLAASGQIDPDLPHAPDLNAALGLGGIPLTEAAYRFAGYEPGLECVLSGTSQPDHLRANLSAVQNGPLPPEVVERLRALFAQVDSVSGQVRP